MMKNYFSGIAATLLISSCATIPDYEPIVDPAMVKDSSKYLVDMQECRKITDDVDYSDEKTKAALKGAVVGAGAVGVAVASTLAVGGVVLLPVVAPIYLLAATIGGKSNSGKTNAEEQRMRAVVWNSCLKERGYVVLSDTKN